MQKITETILDYQISNDEKLLNQLFLHYQDIISKIARKKSNNIRVDFSEVYSDLFSLFVDCLKNFDVSKGVKFNTYFTCSSRFIEYKYFTNEFFELKDTHCKRYNDNNLKVLFENKISKRKDYIEIYNLAIDGYSVAEISKLIKRSKSYVYRRIREMRKILTKVMEDYEN